MLRTRADAPIGRPNRRWPGPGAAGPQGHVRLPPREAIRPNLESSRPPPETSARYEPPSYPAAVAPARVRSRAPSQNPTWLVPTTPLYADPRRGLETSLVLRS